MIQVVKKWEVVFYFKDESAYEFEYSDNHYQNVMTEISKISFKFEHSPVIEIRIREIK